MNIWLINHYAVPTQYYPLARPATFAKHLMRRGHSVTIFAASTVHNSDKNLITDGRLYKEDIVDGIHYVYVRDCNYSGNGLKRILNMFLFPLRLPKACKHFQKPDAILATSVTPMACMEGIKLARKYKCRGVAEIADLWPETFVAYGLIGKKNPVLRWMYAYEKRLYTAADALIFTMQGGRDYIVQKGWDQEHDGSIDLNKIYHINNGVDLESFDYNREHYTTSDPDLDNTNVFNVVYSGAIRRVNQLGVLVDVAEHLHKIGDTRVRFIIYGEGNERKRLETECQRRGLSNILFKGYVSKKYMPYILSKASLNLLQYGNTPILQYGGSMNKSFEYLAAGKPILGNIAPKYDYIESNGCGIMREFFSAKEYAEAILEIANMPKSEYAVMCKNARETAKQYDFGALTSKLEQIIETL